VTSATPGSNNSRAACAAAARSVSSSVS